MFTRRKSQRESDRDKETFRRRKNPRPPTLQLPRSNSINYIPSKTGRIEEETSTGLMWSVAARRGRRRAVREDMYTVLPFITDHYEQPVSIFAIFDGHGGQRAAQFASKRLPDVFLESFRKCGNVKESLEFAFLKTDEELVEDFFRKKDEKIGGRRGSSLFSRKSKSTGENSPSSGRNSGHRKSPREEKDKGLFEGRRMKSREEQMRCSNGCGCTATVVAMVGNTINIAHVGDSRAVLCTKNGVRRLCEDHRPGRPDEQKRIESSGGLILDVSGTPRVNGVLAVSRSIGDAELKDFVIAKPEMKEICLDGCEEFLVVATDGLWDVVSDDDCGMMAREALDNGDEESAAKKLVERAWDCGSNDDTCVMVINLNKYTALSRRDVVDAAEFLSPDGGQHVEPETPRGFGAARAHGELPVEMITPHGDVAPTPRVRKKKAWQ